MDDGRVVLRDSHGQSPTFLQPRMGGNDPDDLDLQSCSGDYGFLIAALSTHLIAYAKKVEGTIDFKVLNPLVTLSQMKA